MWIGSSAQPVIFYNVERMVEVPSRDIARKQEQELPMKTSKVWSAVCLVGMLASEAQAGDFTGTIDWMEVWRSGNVALTLTPAITSCNGQVVLNLSDPGLKNMFATILAAKEAGHA